MDNLNLPSLSIITVTYNCENNLELCLSKIKCQNYPSEKVELVVIDGGSTDTTQQIARHYGARLIIKEEYKNNQEARRSVGLWNAKNEILVYIDSDNFLPENDWLMKMIQPFIDDESIIGTQPLRYAYCRDDPILNRYFSLFGVNDPVAYYLNKSDRLSWAEDKWNLSGKVVNESKNYYKIAFDPNNLPTIGCNGFLIKRDVLSKIDNDPESFFHIDVNLDLINMGYNNYGIVKNDIIHFTGGTILGTFRKRVNYMEMHHQRLGLKRRYRVYDSSKLKDNINIIKYVLFSITLIKPLYDSSRGYLKIKDIAWFLHPIMCIGYLIAYFYSIVFRRVH